MSEVMFHYTWKAPKIFFIQIIKWCVHSDVSAVLFVLQIMWQLRIIDVELSPNS